ncbi:MAG: PH domain-containing protein [Planctomycetes bacterium]|nr:PH domain-containing protein [Planctomycetota bacterium]
MDTAKRGERDAWVRALKRPHPRLFWVYAARSLLGGPLFPFIFVALCFRYHTLRYTFTEEGVTVSWGVLFYKESTVLYRRIQDIHVRRSFLERWLGVATVDIQTASGSAGAEIELEGLEDHEAVRDYLYRRMRGTDAAAAASAAPAAAAAPPGEGEAELVGLLHALRHELEGARKALEGR